MTPGASRQVIAMDGTARRAGADGPAAGFPCRSNHEEMTMPATSKAQQKAAGAALAAKRGEQPRSGLRGASKEMEDLMTEKQLEELAGTDRKCLPEKKD